MRKDTLVVYLPGNLRTAALLCLFLGIGLARAAEVRQTVVVDGRLPKAARSILDLRVERVDFTSISMNAALLAIADAVQRSSGGKLHFSFLVGFSKRAVEEYVRNRIPEEKWKLRDPQIEIHVMSTTLRNVIQKLCDQSGWSYKVTPIGIAFIDDRSYFEEGRKKVKVRKKKVRKGSDLNI